jgi:XTP/dITP diphosphohydrolase
VHRPVEVFVLATANPDKAEEIRAIMGPRVQLLDRPETLGEVEETGATILENARIKATAVAAHMGMPAISDDTGLEVEALDGAPGVHSARYAGPGATYRDNVAKLLGEMKGLRGRDARRACFRTAAVAAWPDGREVVAEGEVLGWIAESPRGTEGFGYDPVFVPDDGDGRTFAELVAADPDGKHRLSHRGRAFRQLADRLAPD